MLVLQHDHWMIDVRQFGLPDGQQIAFGRQRLHVARAQLDAKRRNREILAVPDKARGSRINDDGRKRR